MSTSTGEFSSGDEAAAPDTSRIQTAGGIYNVLFENSTLNGHDSLGNLSGSDTAIQIKADANSGGVTARVTYTGICMTAIKHVLI